MELYKPDKAVDDDPYVPTEDIIALHEEGLPPSEIAARLNTTYYAVQSRLYRAGLTPHPPPKAPKPPPVVEEEKVIALHKEGLASPEIAERLNVSPQLVRAYIRRAGFKPITIVEAKDIIALHNEGLSPSEIAARVNTSPGYITKSLRDAGLKPHPHPVWAEARERGRDILSLHEKGLSTEQIAQTLSLSEVTVRKWLRQARLAPLPNPEEVSNTLRGLDEIVRLAKEDLPRQEIAKRIGSTWPLVAEALERSTVRPVWPACGEVGTWASSLLPILEEIRKAHPDTEPILSKVDELEKELLAISDATWTVEHRLPWRGEAAEEERWCIADISQAAESSLDYVDALKGCVKQLDLVTLPKKLEQAETCISNISNVISGAISEMGRGIPERLGMWMLPHSSQSTPASYEVGDRVIVTIAGRDIPAYIVNTKTTKEHWLRYIVRTDEGKYYEASYGQLQLLEHHSSKEVSMERGLGLPKSHLERAASHFDVPMEQVSPRMVEHVKALPRGTGLSDEREEANENKELLLDILEHQVLGSGLVLNAARAAATSCKCFPYDSQEYCWSPGVLGLMSSKKNPEQIAQFCAVGKTPAGEGVRERFEKVKGAIEEAHREWERKGEGLPGWWSEVAKSLEKHGVEL